MNDFCHQTGLSPAPNLQPTSPTVARKLAAQEAKKGDIGRQTEQVLANIQTALEAAGADLADVVKWNVYVVAGQPLQPGFEAFQKVWGTRPNPLAITAAIAIALARPEFLVEMDAVAVVPEGRTEQIMALL